MTARFTAVAIAALLLLSAGCADDDDTAAATAAAQETTVPAIAASLSDEVREWCTFDGKEDALRWDRIFEEGFQNGLDMNSVNIEASVLRAQYEREGMTSEQAIRRVSEDLFGMPNFVEACQLAYDFHH